MNKLNVTL